MSWDKFFKSHQAIKTSVLSKSESRELLREAKKLERFDDSTKQLYRDAKQLNDVEMGVLRAEQKLVADLALSTQLQTDDSLNQGWTEWTDAVKQHELTVSQLATNTQKIFLDPLKKLSSIFPNVQTAIKRRDQLLVEYNKWYVKVEKYKQKEKTGPNKVKLNTYETNLDSAKNEFTRHNDMLLEEMSRLYESRMAYMLPSLQALIHTQMKHSGQLFKSYAELSNTLEPTSGPATQSMSQPPADDNQADKFAEIKSLSIVASD